MRTSIYIGLYPASDNDPNPRWNMSIVLETRAVPDELVYEVYFEDSTGWFKGCVGVLPRYSAHRPLHVGVEMRDDWRRAMSFSARKIERCKGWRMVAYT